MTDTGTTGNKTKANRADVAGFLEAAPAARQADARSLCALMEQASGQKPVMWGTSIIGFGRYHYRYDSGREGEAPRIGFSPRSTALVLYLPDDVVGNGDLLSRLGKHKTGKGCLYITKLSDVDETVLANVIAASLAEMARRYPEA